MSKFTLTFLCSLIFLVGGCSKGPNGQGNGLIGTGEGFGGNTPPTREPAPNPVPTPGPTWSYQIAGTAPLFSLDACPASVTGTGVAFSSAQTYSSMGLNDITVAFAFKAPRQSGNLAQTMTAIFHKMDNSKTKYPFHCGLYNAAAPIDKVGKVYCEQRGLDTEGRSSIVRVTSSERLDDNKMHVIVFSKTQNTFIAMADGDVFYYQTNAGLTEGGWNTINSAPVQIGSTATPPFNGVVKYSSVHDRGFSRVDLTTYSDELSTLLSGSSN